MIAVRLVRLIEQHSDELTEALLRKRKYRSVNFAHAVTKSWAT